MPRTQDYPLAGKMTNEEDILNIANSVSTTTFSAIYIVNIIIITLYFILISFNLKKSI